jgi:hypothetical protein
VTLRRKCRLTFTTAMPLRIEMTLCEGLLMELPHGLMVAGALSLVFALFGLA